MTASYYPPLDPAVSIILPIYNRAAFLPLALESIAAQTFSDWELIVVDDGSTDETPQLLGNLCGRLTERMRVVRRDNGGAYAARATGLAMARGSLIAFFDSDDYWLPHHLERCALALQQHPELSTVYGACRMVDHTTRRVMCANTFYRQGRPRPFLDLQVRQSGSLRIIQDSRAIEVALRDGIFCGLQNSVTRRAALQRIGFDSDSRNEAEDRMRVVRSLAAGQRFAYYDDVHVLYHVHEGNSSVSAHSTNIEHRVRVLKLLIEGYEQLGKELPLNTAERRALCNRLADQCFWNLGYATLWQHGYRRDAIPWLRKGLALRPRSWKQWKTYLLAIARVAWSPRMVRGAEPAA